MRKTLFVLGVAFACTLLGFFFTRYGPMSALSASQVLSVTSADDLRTMRDERIVTLTKTLEKMTDAESAKKHLSDAQTAYLEMTLINARTAMLNRDNGLAAAPSMKDQPFADLRTQLDRIGKSGDINRELSPALDPLFAQTSIRVIRTVDRPGSLRNTLATLRSQLESYKKQHENKYPDLKTFGWSQLTQKTTANGTIADGAIARNHETFGPYLATLPNNPFTESSKVSVVNKIPADFKASRGAGFVFDESTGRLHGVGPDGKLFDESATADVR